MNFYKIANIAAALGAGAGKNGHKSKEEHKADRLAMKDAANDMPCVNEGVSDIMCDFLLALYHFITPQPF